MSQIDCSHGNSEKQHKRQIAVAEDIVCIEKSRDIVRSVLTQVQATQLETQGSDTAQLIMGVMLESNLVEGTHRVSSYCTFSGIGVPCSNVLARGLLNIYRHRRVCIPQSSVISQTHFIQGGKTFHLPALLHCGTVRASQTVRSLTDIFSVLFHFYYVPCH
jgi:hypothetical protein